MQISDLYPDAALAPNPGTPERGRWYRWLIYLVNPVQSTFYGFIAPGRAAPAEAQDRELVRAPWLAAAAVWARRRALPSRGTAADGGRSDAGGNSWRSESAVGQLSAWLSRRSPAV